MDRIGAIVARAPMELMNMAGLPMPWEDEEDMMHKVDWMLQRT